MQPQVSQEATQSGGQKSPENFKQLVDQAKGLLYGENFESMIKVFEQGGRQGFAEGMATVIVGTLDRLEKENGELDEQTLLYVGLAILAMLSTDLSQGGIIEDLTSDDVQVAAGMVWMKWMESHEDRANMGGALAAMQKQAMQQKREGQMPKGDLQQQTQESGFGGV